MRTLTFTLLLALLGATAHARVAASASSAACQTTASNGYTPKSGQLSGVYGAGPLAARVSNAPDGVRFDAIRRRVVLKLPWFTSDGTPPIVTGRRLDASAPPLIASVGEETQDVNYFNPSLLYFPTRGCWEVTGVVPAGRITFVIEVAVGPDVWTPRKAPSPRARAARRSIAFGWSSAGCASFDVALRRGSGAWRTIRHNRGGTAYTLNQPRPGAQYALRLRCYEDFGRGEWGSPVVVRAKR